MTTYYLSGPMRGLPEHNYPQFFEVEEALAAHLATRRLGFEIINPARNFGGDQTREPHEYMQVDLQAVLNSDVIVLLPGWQNSEGTGHETRVAQATGKRFILAIKGGDTAVDTGAPVPPWSFLGLDGLPPTKQSPRADALTEAQALITGDRNSTYGPPTQDFTRTAGMASAFGFRVIPHEGADPQPIQAHHVAIFMILLKMSRLAWTPGKRDSWVDTAGYAGCGYECAVEEAS